MLKKFLIGSCVIFVLMVGICTIAVFSGGSDSPTSSSSAKPTATTMSSTELATRRDMAVQVIEDYPEVREAAISHAGNEVSMAIVVDYATNEARGRELGDNFVRSYKSLSDDDSPGVKIGRGKYNYLITVVLPNEKVLAQGAKVSFADRISW